MPIHLVLNKVGRFERVPLTWRPLQTPEGKSATIVCPFGHYGALDHTIHPDGRVEPSVICPETSCGWHEFVVLDGWQQDSEEAQT